MTRNRKVSRARKALLLELVTVIFTLGAVQLGAIELGASSADAAPTPWTVQTSPSPGTPLYGVSCANPTSCVAVGGQNALTESWNGSSWTITSSPDEGNGSILWSASCTSPVDCFAVGTYTPSGTESQQTLIESFDGTSWSTVSSPNSVGHNNLYSVSCTSASFCMAVGYDGDTEPDPTFGSLVETWNGTAWSVETSPGIGELTGVSCLSSSECTVSGSHKLMTWNGTSWKVVKTPLSSNDFLSSVTCASATNCVAVGEQTVASSPYFRTLILFWHGKNWVVTASPNRGTAKGKGGADNQLFSVSCTSSKKCVAVGDGDGTLVETLSGTSWKIASSQNLGDSGTNYLYGSACPSATSCEAVGTYSDETAGQTLIETGSD